MAAMNFSSSLTDEISDDIIGMEVTEFISDPYKNCEFSLDVRMFDKHQQ